MTDRRPLLRAIFDAAVARAHPDTVLSAHLRPAPKGRVICLAAGKGAKVVFETSGPDADAKVAEASAAIARLVKS